MRPELTDRFMDYNSVKGIWEVVKINQLSSQKDDESWIVDLNKRDMEILQEHRTVTKYSNELSKIWNELDYYRSLLTDPIGGEYILRGRHC